MLCWGLWNRRNKWLWEKANDSAFGVLAAARNLLGKWKEAQLPGIQNRQVDGARQWEKPNAGWIKVNVDATIFGGSIGCGAVRDAEGTFLGAMCRRIGVSGDQGKQKLLHSRNRYIGLLDYSFEMCVFETDSKTLVHACNGDSGDSFFGTILNDCVQLQKHISQVLIKFVFRSANSVAHELARATYSLSDKGEWYTTPTNFISHVLELDITS